MRKSILLCVLALAAACGGAEADLNNEETPILPEDAIDQSSLNPAVPVLSDKLPSRIPYPVVTLQGTAFEAERVIIEVDGRNPYTKRVGTQNAFCIDIPVDDPGVYTFRIYSHARGKVSGMTEVTTEVDPNAPPIPGATTCTGADPLGCGQAVEICGNNRDDDCNGFADDFDAACNDCTRDYLEPNGDPSAPALAPGTYPDLHLCDGDDDYYGIEAQPGDVLFAKIYFAGTDGNLEMQLIAPDGETVVAESMSSDSDETITHTAADAGKYTVRVTGDAQGDSADYRLFTRRTPAGGI